MLTSEHVIGCADLSAVAAVIAGGTFGWCTGSDCNPGLVMLVVPTALVAAVGFGIAAVPGKSVLRRRLARMPVRVTFHVGLMAAAWWLLVIGTPLLTLMRL